MYRILCVSLIASVLFVGCSSKSKKIETSPGNNPVAPSTPSDMPSWFTETPPEDDEYIYQGATADMFSMNNAIQSAIQDGQRLLAETIEVKVMAMVKNYSQEAGISETTDHIKFFESTSKSVSNNTMRGAVPLKKHPYQKKNGGWRVYVLMGLKQDAVQGEIVSAIQNEEAMYVQFKASQSFQALEEEFSK